MFLSLNVCVICILYSSYHHRVFTFFVRPTSTQKRGEINSISRIELRWFLFSFLLLTALGRMELQCHFRVLSQRDQMNNWARRMHKARNEKFTIARRVEMRESGARFSLENPLSGPFHYSVVSFRFLRFFTWKGVLFTFMVVETVCSWTLIHFDVFHLITRP